MALSSLPSTIGRAVDVLKYFLTLPMVVTITEFSPNLLSKVCRSREIPLSLVAGTPTRGLRNWERFGRGKDWSGNMRLGTESGIPSVEGQSIKCLRIGVRLTTNNLRIWDVSRVLWETKLKE